MSATECIHEIEITEAVTQGRWPAGCSKDVQVHAETCPICQDVLQVALALKENQAAAFHAARLPSAGLVWWRSEMRSRRDALDKATRPIRIVEWAALACALAVAFALVLWIGPSTLTDLLSQPSHLLFAGLGVLAVLSTLVVYFVFSRD